MWSPKEVEKYWHERAQKSDSPCHYMNKWQDRYAYRTRLNAFKKRDFTNAKMVVDIGCGVGDYTAGLTRLAPQAKFIGFDFPFHIEIAKRKYGHISNIEFREGPVPSKELEAALKNNDVAIMTTVYQHLPLDARDKLLGYFTQMKPGARVILLEYMPDSVPSFQKGLGYKEIESFSQIVERFGRHKLKLIEKRDVNFVDSFFFHHLKENVFTYLLTITTDWIFHIIRVKKSKYKLLVVKSH